METNVQDLLNKYEEIYLSRSRDFNALTTVHLSENDHTNILCEILNMKVGDKKPFMESFVREVLGMDYNECDILVAKTQVQAISAKGLGFIDLLIVGNGKHIIVENKVCGAGDGPFQLARYYFSYIKEDEDYLKQLLKKCSWEEFKQDEKKYAEKLQDSYNEWWNKKIYVNNTDLYIVYLTDIADKQPSKNSLPKDLKDRLRNHYIPISYEEDIYDWLKTKVLPQVPYGKNGDAVNSIILYRRELENILASNAAQNQWYLETEQVQDFIKKIYHAPDSQTNVQKYERLDAIYKNLTEAAKLDEYKDNSILSDLISCVLCWRNNVFGQFAPEGWTVYCDGTYIKFYPTRWLEKYGGTTACNIHFLFNNWQKENVTIFDFNIHGDACKKYIHTLSNEKKYEEVLTAMDSTNEFIRNGKRATISYQESKTTTNWHLRFDSQKIENKIRQWDPENPEPFFSAFVGLEQIQNLVKYIDDNFK